jgi:hypothetical protein
MTALNCGAGVPMQYENLTTGRLDGRGAFPANRDARGVVPTLKVFGNAKLVRGRAVKYRRKINELSLKRRATGAEEHIGQGKYHQYPEQPPSQFWFFNLIGLPHAGSIHQADAGMASKKFGPTSKKTMKELLGLTRREASFSYFVAGLVEPGLYFPLAPY